MSLAVHTKSGVDAIHHIFELTVYRPAWTVFAEIGDQQSQGRIRHTKETRLNGRVESWRGWMRSHSV